MICPLLSYQSRYSNCQGSSCAWWDTVRKCCAIVPVSFGDVIRKHAAARLDSDPELSGGAQE